MSDGTFAENRNAQHDTTNQQEGVIESAKHEASDLKDTTTDAAKDVASTVKDETGAVAHETKAQVKDLYREATRELSDQASTQQQRIASGLGAIGDELGSMARNSQGTGIAADLVQRAGDRASSAAAWLDSRDPSGVLDDVKAFARRRPALFIGGALLVGLVAGRLVRALASNAHDDSGAASTPSVGSSAAARAVPSTGAPSSVGATTSGAPAPTGAAVPTGLAGGTAGGASGFAAPASGGAVDAPADPQVVAAVGVEDDSPLYDESAQRLGNEGDQQFGREDEGAPRERPDAF